MPIADAPPAVRLRPLAPADLAVHAAGCDDLVVRWSGGGRPSTDAEHLAWLERQERAWAEREDVVDLAVLDAGTGEHVGVVGIQWRRPELAPGDLNLTYALYAGHRGRGWATAATRAAMGIALTWWPVERFVIRCDPANTGSAAVARRLGFTEHGLVPEPDGALLLRFTAPPALGIPDRQRDPGSEAGSR